MFCSTLFAVMSMNQSGAFQRKLLLASRQGLSYIKDTYRNISNQGWKWTEQLTKTVFCSTFLRQLSLTSVIAHKYTFSMTPTRISSDNSRFPLHLAEIYVLLMKLKACKKKFHLSSLCSRSFVDISLYFAYDAESN